MVASFQLPPSFNHIWEMRYVPLMSLPFSDSSSSTPRFRPGIFNPIGATTEPLQLLSEQRFGHCGEDCTFEASAAG
jgi:hypothetical protein